MHQALPATIGPVLVASEPDTQPAVEIASNNRVVKSPY